MATKKTTGRRARKPTVLKANLGQTEAKQQEISSEQMSQMKG
jgi:hypothetical protein